MWSRICITENMRIALLLAAYAGKILSYYILILNWNTWKITNIFIFVGIVFALDNESTDNENVVRRGTFPYMVSILGRYIVCVTT